MYSTSFNDADIQKNRYFSSWECIKNPCECIIELQMQMLSEFSTQSYTYYVHAPPHCTKCITSTVMLMHTTRRHPVMMVTMPQLRVVIMIRVGTTVTVSSPVVVTVAVVLPVVAQVTVMAMLDLLVASPPVVPVALAMYTPMHAQVMMTAALVSMASLPAAMVAVSPTATWVMAMLVPPVVSAPLVKTEADPSEMVIPILIEDDEGVPHLPCGRCGTVHYG